MYCCKLPCLHRCLSRTPDNIYGRGVGVTAASVPNEPRRTLSRNGRAAARLGDAHNAHFRRGHAADLLCRLSAWQSLPKTAQSVRKHNARKPATRTTRLWVCAQTPALRLLTPHRRVRFPKRFRRSAPARTQGYSEEHVALMQECS